jgi:hypothetical protein
MSLSKYSRDEKVIVRKIIYIQRRMSKLRKSYLDLDIKRINLIHKLNGKYKAKR